MIFQWAACRFLLLYDVYDFNGFQTTEEADPWNDISTTEIILSLKKKTILRFPSVYFVFPVARFVKKFGKTSSVLLDYKSHEESTLKYLFHLRSQIGGEPEKSHLSFWLGSKVGQQTLHSFIDFKMECHLKQND